MRQGVEKIYIPKFFTLTINKVVVLAKQPTRLGCVPPSCVPTGSTTAGNCYTSAHYMTKIIQQIILELSCN